MNVTVTDHMKTSHTFSGITGSTTVLHLKGMVKSKNKVPEQHQLIIFSGKLLEDNRTLASYGLEDGADLVMVLRLIGD